MLRFPYFAALLCLALMLVVFSLGDATLSPAVLCGMLIGIAFLCVAIGRPLRLLGAMRCRLLVEE